MTGEGSGGEPAAGEGVEGWEGVELVILEARAVDEMVGKIRAAAAAADAGAAVDQWRQEHGDEAFRERGHDHAVVGRDPDVPARCARRHARAARPLPRRQREDLHRHASTPRASSEVVWNCPTPAWHREPAGRPKEPGGKESAWPGTSRPTPSSRRSSTGSTSSSATRSSRSTSSSPHPYDLTDPVRQELIPPLQQQVRERGLWACHLGPELGGPGYGQVKLALLNEILGRAHCGPIVFGCQAPDSGNAEILAHYGTPEQKERYLQPLLDNEIVSCFSMTEPQGGADPKVFTTHGRARRRRVGHQRREVVLLERPLRRVPHRHGGDRSRQPALPAACRCSSSRPTRPASRSSATSASATRPPTAGTHAYIRYNDVRVPKARTCSATGAAAFVVAQTRLGGGRIHHAMRTVGMVQRAFDMMCERALSRTRRASCWAASRWCRR